jgi:hypothetical protein
MAHGTHGGGGHGLLGLAVIPGFRLGLLLLCPNRIVRGLKITDRDPLTKRPGPAYSPD